MTKRLLTICLCLLLSGLVLAQTQQGVVKTPGRTVINKGKKKLVHGEGLVGATVNINGEIEVRVKDASGVFSFHAPKGKYVIKGVEKLGYQLVDEDILNKPHYVSKDRIILTMEKPLKYRESQLATAKSMNEQLSKDLKRKEKEVDEQKRKNKITEAQYEELKRKLYEQEKTGIDLIIKMAEYEAKLDYDNLNEFDRLWAECFQNGDLNAADSLLRSKGNIDVRIRDVNLLHEANEKMREVLEQSERGEQLQNDELARDIMNYCMLFTVKNEYDSVAYFIEKRADLDGGSNFQWQVEAGTILQKIGYPARAMTRYNKALSTIRSLAVQEPEIYEPLLAKVLNNIALLLNEAGNKQEAESLYHESITLFQRMAKAGSTTCLPYLAAALNNLAVVNLNDSSASQKVVPLLLESLNIYDNLSQEAPEVFNAKKAEVINNLSLYYQSCQQPDKCWPLLNKALSIYRQLNDTTEVYDADIAMILNTMSTIISNPEQRITLVSEAIEIYRRLEPSCPLIYQPLLASSLVNLATYQAKTSRMAESDNALQEALGIFRSLSEHGGTQYMHMAAERYYEQGIRYFEAGNYAKSKPFLEQSMDCFRSYSALSRNQCLHEKAAVLDYLGTVCYMLHQWPEADSLYQEELNINTTLADSLPQEYKQDLARSYSNLSSVKLMTGDFAQAEQLARTSLAIDDSWLLAQTNLAAALLLQGQEEPAANIYRRYRGSLKDEFLGDLQQLESLGIIPSESCDAVERIKTIINQHTLK